MSGRSGSSLLGELLSLHPSSSYYFEPLFPLKLSCKLKANSSSVAGRASQQYCSALQWSPPGDMEKFIGGILRCEKGSISRITK